VATERTRVAPDLTPNDTYILVKQADDRGLDLLFHAMQVPGAALLENCGKGSNFRPVNP
jgi:hypothetical protein